MKITNTKISLKKCPFCNGSASVYAYEREGAEIDYTYGVKCESCGVRTISTFLRAEDAAEKWNTRTALEGYMLIAVDDNKIKVTFHENEGSAFSAMREDACIYKNGQTIEELLDANKKGTFARSPKGYWWALKEKDGTELRKWFIVPCGQQENA